MTDGFFDGAPGRRNAFPPGLKELNEEHVGWPVNVGRHHSSPATYFYGRPRQIRLGLRATL